MIHIGKPDSLETASLAVGGGDPVGAGGFDSADPALTGVHVHNGHNAYAVAC